MPPNGVAVEDLTLDDSDEDEVQITKTSRRYTFKDEFTPVRIDKPCASVPKSSSSQKQPVASKAPVSDTKPVASGSKPVASGSRATSVNSNASGSQSVVSGSHGPLFVPGTSMRTKNSGRGPISSPKTQNYNKRTASKSRTDPAKRRKTTAKGTVKEAIDVDDSSDGIEEITTPTPRGYDRPASSRKGQARISITPQARHRSAPRTVVKPQQAAPSEPILIDDDDEDDEDHNRDYNHGDGDDEIMVIDPPPQFEYVTAKAESLVTEPLDLSNIGESLKNDMSDSDNDEISDQDANGGYTFGLSDVGIWKELPQHSYTAEAQPADASSFRQYRSPRILLHELNEEDEPPPAQEMHGNTDEEIFEAAVKQINREAEPPTTWMMMHRSQRGGPLGNSRRYALSTKHRLELNVKERDADKPLAASGSVLSIAQAPGYVAVGSTTFRGNIHDDGPDVDENDDGGFANSLGCLRVWDNEDRYPLSGHHSEWILGQEGNRVHRQRHYEVKEVVFDCTDPDQPHLLSAGGDGYVQIWRRREPRDDDAMSVDGDEDEDSSDRLKLMTDIRAWKARSCPTTLRLRSHDPEDRTLAVGCSNGTVYVYDDYLSRATDDDQTVIPHYELGPTQITPHPTGEVLWGRDAWLYASTESIIDGAHWAINTGKRGTKGKERLCDRAGRPVSHSGDAMALSVDNERLALFTRSGRGEHTTYLYDVLRNNFRATTTLKLEGFPHRTDISSEVTCAKFSPDGLFLAVARNDNFTHIYDARMLDEPIYRLGHAEYQANDSILGTNYGVTHLEWVEEHRGGGLGLVTGGGDGCVYLWDMLRAHSADPDLLAETDHGVATFSLGDRGNGEKRLVVGDCGGQVRFFD